LPFLAVLLGTNLPAFADAPSQSTTVWVLAENVGGYSCMEASDRDTQCTLVDVAPEPDLITNRYISQNIQVLNDQSNTLYIYPNDGYQVASIRIGLIDQSSNLIPNSDVVFNYDEQPFTFDSDVYTWSVDGNLIIPVGISNIEIRVTFEVIPTVIELNKPINGEICVDSIGMESILCSVESITIIEYDSQTFEGSIEFNPDDNFRLASVSISVAGATAVAYTIAEDELPEGTIVAQDQDGNNYGFSWDAYRQLSPPSPAPNFEISATFVELPPLIQAPSIISGEAAFGKDIPFQILSSDPEQANDYSDIAYLFLTLTYFGIDPNNPANTNARLRCKIQLENSQISDDMESMYVWLPELQDFMADCPGYHITTATTTADLSLYEEEDLEAILANSISPTQSVALNIPSPPAITDLITEGEISFGDSLTFSVSNQNNIRHVELELILNQISGQSCIFVRNLRDIDGNLISSYFDQDQNLILEIPTVAEVNTNCADRFIEGESSIDQSQAHQVFITAFDQYNNYEQYEVITIAAAAPAPAPTPAPVFIPILPTITPEPYLPIQEPINQSNKSESNSQDSSEVATKSDLDQDIEKVSSTLESTSWCKKKGIWVYTQTGKLQMCDPVRKIALEMPACAGKAKTPTYPWVFRAQRFIPGITHTKSGTDLHNAVFFYKGLAISGSDEVSKQPCSNGSIFIPMQLSKTVYEFAKAQKPLIWVKNT
jgi:hypothetical protein